ncbi:MAG TPA: gluconeogenesis factor YvcK family protein [Acidimicrobiales bacterium]|nr:gluconeogenesis factor YvcK family protein [Acidimicrobiales bacterium]
MRTGRPNVVALGGGHGLAVTLSAVSRYAGSVTAVVSGADDGGSSGRLRAWWGGPAPGDVRRCLLAIAGDSPEQKLWAEALDHRFAEGELAGHSLGNLVLVGLSETLGDFAEATAQLGRLVGATARILPATSEAVQLWAEVDGPGGPAEIEGQAAITHSPVPVRRVWLSPPTASAPEPVLAAIAGADQVVLGPGSLYTSVLAVCAVPGIRDALAERSKGRRRGGTVYVCNLGPQEPETSGYDADAHLAALASHGVAVSSVLCDPSTPSGAPARSEELLAGANVVEAAVSGPDGHAHDPARLAEALAGLVAR